MSPLPCPSGWFCCEHLSLGDISCSGATWPLQDSWPGPGPLLRTSLWIVSESLLGRMRVVQCNNKYFIYWYLPTLSWPTPITTLTIYFTFHNLRNQIWHFLLIIVNIAKTTDKHLHVDLFSDATYSQKLKCLRSESKQFMQPYIKKLKQGFWGPLFLTCASLSINAIKHESK